MPEPEAVSGTGAASVMKRDYLMQGAVRLVGVIVALVVVRLALRAFGVQVPIWLWAGSIPFLQHYLIMPLPPAPPAGYAPGAKKGRFAIVLFFGILTAVMAEVLLG